MSIQKEADVIVGATSTLIGSTGITFQFITNVASLGVIALNAILAIGGIYILCLRAKKLKSEIESINKK